MMSKDEIAEVVRYLDAESEEFDDMQRFWGKRDVELSGLVEVAEQRGLRVVMMRRGMNPNVTKVRRIALNREQQQDHIQFTGCFLDGFAAGWDARGRHDGGS